MPKTGKKESPVDAYRTRLSLLSDEQLKREWDAEWDYADYKWKLQAVKHEMALRFMGRSKSQKDNDKHSYFWDKLLESSKEFGDLVMRKEWFRAKYLYERASILCVFLETPEEIRNQLFGYSTDDDVYIDGIFYKAGVNKVMNECLIKNRLGYECIVYRIPGEVGYHGAKELPGTRRMLREENPAYIQEVLRE